MKIQHLEIQNFQALRHVDLSIPTPLAMIGGDNEAGKSSLCEAIRLALTGEQTRVALKKEMGEMVTDGATKGHIFVDVDGAGVSVSLPDGKAHGNAPENPFLPFVLQPSRFASTTTDERRTLLFKLTKVAASSASVLERMKARGCAESLASGVLPMLRSGFPAAHDYAAGQAKDCKSAWRGVTGEAWGEKKAPGWSAAKPEFDLAALTAINGEIAELDERIGGHQQSLGALREKASAFQAYQAQAAQREKQAAQLPALRNKLAVDEKQLAEWQAKVEDLTARAGTGPRQGLVHDLARAVDYLLGFTAADASKTADDLAAEAALASYEAQYGKLGGQGDPDAAAELAKAIQARDLMQRAVNNDRRDIAAGEAAASGTDAAAVEVVEPSDLQAAEQALQQLKEKRAALSKRHHDLLTAQRASEQADKKTAEAAKHHADAIEWLKIAAALAPDGIPGELLADALRPVNALLAELSELAGWATVRIDPDMTIRAGGRMYRMQSASAQWRADTILALAIAELSGLRCVLLDAFDILNMAGRVEVIDLLDVLAESGRIDTAILLGTLKAPPSAPTDAYTAFWLQDGALGDTVLQQKAA
ncbi:AAA family ATPase [Orrella sp. JC864]|uniref:AAA family ATPase n=1 Tax=Orrella sp. JC864 TaxID=3120298 RepID=UPI00300A19B8